MFTTYLLNLNPFTAVLFFGGAPLLIWALVALVVYLPSWRRRRLLRAQIGTRQRRVAAAAAERDDMSSGAPAAQP